MARASTYTAQIGAEICGRLAAGESLRSICRDDAMPGQSVVYGWLRQHESFRDLYTLAREDQVEFWADEIIEIADDSSRDRVERAKPDGSTELVVDHEHINRSRLRVDARKWLLSKLLPKKYGEMARLEHTGSDGGPIVIASALEEARKRAAIDVPFQAAGTDSDAAAALPAPQPAIADVASALGAARRQGAG